MAGARCRDLHRRKLDGAKGQARPGQDRGGRPHGGGAGAMNGPALNSVRDLEERLRELHRLTAQTPLYNPVFQLGLELSRKLENGEMSLNDIEALVAEMECEGLRARAARIDRLLRPLPIEDNSARIDAAATEDDF